MARCERIAVMANDDFAIIINGARFSVASRAARKLAPRKTRDESFRWTSRPSIGGQKLAKRVSI
jgi:hypothetical protein